MSPTDKEILEALSEKANEKHKEEQLNKNNEQADNTSLEENKNPQEEQTTAQELAITDKETEEEQEEDSEEFHGFPTPETIAEEEEKTNNIPAVQEKQDSKEEDHKDAEKDAEEENPMTLLDHLKELRIRLTRVFIIIFIGFFACYGIAEPVYALLAAPLQANMPTGASFIFTSPQGAFFVYLKVALVLSFFASSPFTFYQIWAFIAPGLYKEERRMLIPLALISAFFFISGATFCYFLVFPIAFNFFMGFATDIIIPMISIEEYLSFVLKLLIAFGLVFEMPLFAFFLGSMKLLTAKRMRSWRKYAVLVIFIVAAVLTPPDVFSQTLMALPMLFLYEVSIWVVAFVNKPDKAQPDKPQPDKVPEEEKTAETPTS